MNYILAVVFGLGFASGLRSLAPAVVVAWADHLGWLNLNNSPLGFMSSISSPRVVSILRLHKIKWNHRNFRLGLYWCVHKYISQKSLDNDRKENHGQTR